MTLGFRPDGSETTAIIPAGSTLRIRPVFEDGSTGDWMTPVYTDNNDGVIKDRVDSNYSIYWDDLQSYEILSNINWEFGRQCLF